MQRVKLIVENTFADLSSNNKEIGISVFDRVFNKLTSGGGPLGKVRPIYLKFGSHVKTIGILTMNTSGSYSFFPELPGKSEFDHMTFNRNITKDKHHYTRLTDIGREKVLPITAEHLTNNTYHVASIIFQDHSLLKAAPKEIIYPDVDISQFHEIENAFLTSGKPEGSSMLKLDSDIGCLCLQFFLVPNNLDYERMTFFKKPLKLVEPNFELEDGTISNGIIIPHEYQTDYSFGILAFNYNKIIKESIQIITGAKQQGFYSKLDIN